MTTKSYADALVTTGTIGSLINSATAKTTPVDADMFGLMDSAASNVLKKFSWANMKTNMETYLNGKYVKLVGSGSLSISDYSNVIFNELSYIRLVSAVSTAQRSIQIINDANSEITLHKWGSTASPYGLVTA